MQQQQEQYHRQQKFQLNSRASIDTHQPTSYTTNMQQTFRSVMMSDIGLNGDSTQCDPGSNFSSFNSDYDERHPIDADDIAILNRNNSPKDNEPMSARRRFCFVISLLLCVFVVVGFVWLVPCNEGSVCPAPVDRIKTHNWLNNYTKIELKSGVNIVNGLRSWENNLIFLYRGDILPLDVKELSPNRNGIISLIGSSGAVAWYDKMLDEPIAIDCTLIDIDRNGRPDCIVMDEFGELGAINPISGQWHWRFNERSVVRVDAVDFPVILPDLDGDGVQEILLVTSPELQKRTRNYMKKVEVKPKDRSINGRNLVRILSGSSGKPIGEGYKVHDCDFIRKLQLEKSQIVTYNCLRNNTEAQRSKTLADLYSLITNKSIVGQKLVPAAEISQHRYRHYEQRKDGDAQRNIYSLSGRELVVENRGTCPEDCNVTLILSENVNGKIQVHRNFTSPGMYGMVPAQWHFKNTKKNMSGFVMKVWNWRNMQDVSMSESSSYNIQKTFLGKKGKLTSAKGGSVKSSKQNYTESNKTKKNRRKREMEHEFPTKEFNTFDQFVQKRRAYTISMPEEIRVTRSIANMTKQKPNSSFIIENYKMQMITETVILVLFINNNTRIENTSQSNIVQFCRNDLNEVICQPDLNNQENSMIIADLDEDDSQELVSYTSTFVQSSDDPDLWKLVTYVRLLRLESELPAFYDDEKHN